MSSLRWLAPSRAPHPARDAAIRSYEAVIAKDKAAWLANFADDAVIEDPVGPSMFDEAGAGHRGADARSAFWDLTIATVADFVFEIRDSFACGDECANVGTFHTTMIDGTRVDVDLAITYRVDRDGKLLSLRAFWEQERAFATARPAD